MDKKLFRSSTDKMIAGVCAGIAKYINIDPTAVRVLYALITAFSVGVPGIIAYIILAVIMPVDQDEQPPAQ